MSRWFNSRLLRLMLEVGGKVVLAGSPVYAVLLTLVTQSFVVVLNIGTGVITARLLGRTGRGVFMATTIWPQFLAGIGALGLPAAIIYYLRNYPEGKRQIVGAAYLVTLLISLAATAAGVILVPLISSTAPHSTILLAQFCVLWTFTNMLTVCLRQIMVASGSFREFSRSSYLPPLFFLICLIIAWPLFGMSAEVAATCLMLSSLLSMVWMFFSVNPVVRPRLASCGPWVRKLLRYSMSFAASDLSVTLLSFLDRLVLIPFLSAADLGLYAVAYSLSRLMLILQTVSGSVLYPLMAGRTPYEIKHLHDLAFRLTLYAAFIAVVITFAVGYPALTIVYGPDYANAMPLLRVLITEAAVTCVGQVVVQLYLSLNQPAFPSMVQALTLVTAAVSLLLLVPLYGALGAGGAVLIAAVVRLSILLAGLRIRLGLPLPHILPQVGDVAFVHTRLF